MVGLGLLPYTTFAQTSFSGKIYDAEKKEALVAAVVSLDNKYSTLSDDEGNFLLKKITPGTYELKISFIGYKSIRQQVNLNSPATLDFYLEKSSILAEEALIVSSRLENDAAATYTLIDKQDLEKTNLGQDLPYLLNQTPSVVVSSDAGTGIGYTGIRIRGTDATRTNVTINGIPLNDAESQGTFLVNIPDFATFVDNIQIQRGVGTSTNGAGAFGASINMETDKISAEPYAEVNTTHGSFRTDRYSAKVGTGIINKHWAFTGRLSKIASQGYIDNSSSKLKSFFTSAAYFDEKNLVKMNVFSGTERTHLAWYGVPEDSLQTNRRYNPLKEPFPHQTDNYQQDHYQVFYTRKLNADMDFNLGYHFTRGQGYYEEYRAGEDFAGYGMDTLFTGGDTILQTNIVRRRWLSNEFQGIIYSFDYRISDKLRLTLGGAANEYDGEHFGEVVWAEYASNKNMYDRFYTSYGNKDEINFYTKISYSLKKMNLFADVQYRWVDYTISGIDKDGIDITQNDQLNFLNPKIGASYQINPKQLAYVSFGIANKEPNRDDYTQAIVQGKKPKPEHLKDLEIGLRSIGKKIRYEVNLFHMHYRDQLVLTGEINDVGDFVRSNIPESFRQGIELSASWNIHKKITWSPNVAFSRNIVKDFTEMVYAYDADYNYIGAIEHKHSNTQIAFSPGLIAGSVLQYTLYKNLNLSLFSKYVSEQYLDNTGNDNRKMDAFFVNDLALDYRFGLKGLKRVDIIFRINNVFNELYVANGYTYTEVYDGVQSNYNSYYPQAERNYLLGLNLKF